MHSISLSKTCARCSGSVALPPRKMERANWPYTQQARARRKPLGLLSSGSTCSLSMGSSEGR